VIWFGVHFLEIAPILGAPDCPIIPSLRDEASNRPIPGNELPGYLHFVPTGQGVRLILFHRMLGKGQPLANAIHRHYPLSKSG
jgi:hypothetical protein